MTTKVSSSKKKPVVAIIKATKIKINKIRKSKKPGSGKYEIYREGDSPEYRNDRVRRQMSGYSIKN